MRMTFRPSPRGRGFGEAIRRVRGRVGGLDLVVRRSHAVEHCPVRRWATLSKLGMLCNYFLVGRVCL